jgi:hypothetical protein
MKNEREITIISHHLSNGARVLLPTSTKAMDGSPSPGPCPWPLILTMEVAHFI